MKYIKDKSDIINDRLRDLRILLLDNIREDVEISVRYETEIIDSLIIIIENKLKYIRASLNSKFCHIVGRDNKISGDEDIKTIKTIVMAISNTPIEDKIYDVVSTIGKLFEIKNYSKIRDEIMQIYNYTPVFFNEKFSLAKEIVKNTLLEILLKEEMDENYEYKSIQ